VTLRPPWAAFRAALEESGFRPSKRLGQNFLLDENMMRAIVRDARVGAGDFVLEIGAGCGFLSLHLAEAGAEVVAVEIDRRLLAIAERLLSGRGRVRLVGCDVLAGKHVLAPEVEALLPRSTWHLVSNLPYSIAAPVLAVLAAHERAPKTITVLVQREVAQRIAASPGTAAWGALAVRLQSRYAASILRTVPAALFWPRPRVESAVVRLERREGALHASNLRFLDGLAGDLFTSRRQTLGRALARRIGDRETGLSLLREAGIDPGLRAETLGLEPLARLAGLVRQAERRG